MHPPGKLGIVVGGIGILDRQREFPHLAPLDRHAEGAAGQADEALVDHRIDLGVQSPNSCATNSRLKVASPKVNSVDFARLK